MRTIFVALLVAMPLISAATSLAAEPLEVAKANQVYQDAMKLSSEMAAKALQLLGEVEKLNEKAKGLGVPTNKLPRADLAKLRNNTEELGTLYSHNVIEASLIRDMLLLDNLYKAAMFLHAQQQNYIEQTGSIRGFDKYLAGLRLDRQQHFHMEILHYLHRLVPSEMEANPGTPTPNPTQ